jgi:hypothetical protein
VHYILLFFKNSKVGLKALFKIPSVRTDFASFLEYLFHFRRNFTTKISLNPNINIFES